MDSFSVISASPEQTDRIGALVAQRLTPGDAVLLNGDLAAGKTRLVKAIVAALGSQDLVTSPTFALAQFYRADGTTILHIDTYRLSGVEEYRDLALEDYAADAITLIEWGSAVESEFPAHLSIRFESLGGSERQLTFSSPVERWTELFPELQKDLS